MSENEGGDGDGVQRITSKVSSGAVVAQKEVTGADPDPVRKRAKQRGRPVLGLQKLQNKRRAGRNQAAFFHARGEKPEKGKGWTNMKKRGDNKKKTVKGGEKGCVKNLKEVKEPHLKKKTATITNRRWEKGYWSMG